MLGKREVFKGVVWSRPAVDPRLRKLIIVGVVVTDRTDLDGIACEDSDYYVEGIVDGMLDGLKKAALVKSATKIGDAVSVLVDLDNLKPEDRSGE